MSPPQLRACVKTFDHPITGQLVAYAHTEGWAWFAPILGAAGANVTRASARFCLKPAAPKQNVHNMLGGPRVVFTGQRLTTQHRANLHIEVGTGLGGSPDREEQVGGVDRRHAPGIDPALDDSGFLRDQWTQFSCQEFFLPPPVHHAAFRWQTLWNRRAAGTDKHFNPMRPSIAPLIGHQPRQKTSRFPRQCDSWAGHHQNSPGDRGICGGPRRPTQRRIKVAASTIRLRITTVIPQRWPARRAQQREDFVDAGDQHCPQVMCLRPFGCPRRRHQGGALFAKARNRFGTERTHRRTGRNTRPGQSRGQRCRISDICERLGGQKALGCGGRNGVGSAESARGGAGCRAWALHPLAYPRESVFDFVLRSRHSLTVHFG